MRDTLVDWPDNWYSVRSTDRGGGSRPLQPIIILGAIWVVAFGLTGALLAARHARPPMRWAVLGALFGPIALVVLLTGPPGRCPTCDAPVRDRSNICYWCGNPIVKADGVKLAPAALPRAGAVEETPAPRVRAKTLSERTVPTPSRAQAHPAPSEAPAPAPVEARRRTTGRAQAERASREPAAQRPAAEPAAQPPAAEPAAQRPAASGAAVPATPLPALKAPPPEPLPVPRMPNYPRAISEAVEAAPAAAPATVPEPEPRQVLATAVYMTGSAGLLVGCRYALAVEGQRFMVLGPIDQDPTTVALERSLTQVDATGINGRLVISKADGELEGVLVFVSLAGAPADLVADRLIAYVPRIAAGEKRLSQSG